MMCNTVNIYFFSFKTLEYLDISHYPEGQDRIPVRYDEIISSTLSTMSTLKSLDISGCHIHQVTGNLKQISG